MPANPPSPHSANLSAIFNDLNSYLATKFSLPATYQADPLPGEGYVLLSPTGWMPDEIGAKVSAVISVVEAYDTYLNARTGLLARLCDVDNWLPMLDSRDINKRGGLLLTCEAAGQITTDLQAKLDTAVDLPPYWIGEITAPVTMQLAVKRRMVGRHLG